jgi:hypothetical protein
MIENHTSLSRRQIDTGFSLRLCSGFMGYAQLDSRSEFRSGAGESIFHSHAILVS